MDRFRRSIVEDKSSFEAANGGLDWRPQNGRNLVCKISIPPDKTSREAVTVLQVGVSPAVWMESGKAGKNEDVPWKGRICEDMISVSSQSCEKEQIQNQTYHNVSKRMETDQETKERSGMSCAEDF